MPEARTKNMLKALSGALIAAALVVAPLVTAGATAAPKDKEPTEIVGTLGTVEPMSAKANDVDYWNARYAQFDAICYKHGDERNAHGSVTDGGKTVTLNEFQDDWPGDQWVVLIVKGATSNNIVENPKANVAYASPLTKDGGPQSTVSHWIVCKGTVPTTPTLVTPKFTYTPATCDAPGTVTRGDEVDWTFEVDEKAGTTTWVATPKKGSSFPAGTLATWTVPTDLSKLVEDCEPATPVKPEPKQTDKVTTTFDCTKNDATVTTVTTTIDYAWNDETKTWDELAPVDAEPVVTHRALTDAEKQTCPPETTTVTSEWKDGTWVCGDTTVEQTRTVTTTVGDAEPTVITEKQKRDLTQAEIGTCPLVPGAIDAVCVGDVPYLGYGLTLPEGFVADSETPVTITFLNPDGEDYVVTGQPLSGSLLWPGASAGEPKMWPGWELVDGEYAQTDGNFAWTREGVTVRFDVNPTYSTEVEYPEASAECANPPIGSGDEPTPGATPAVAASGDLAVTGGGVSPVLVAAGGATLAAGIAVVAIAAYRRRRAAAE